MGEIAEDMIEGCCCSQCGQYFADPDDPERLYCHGYPVLCAECWVPGSELSEALTDTL